MVTFVCNDCGQSVKKNQIEKHSFKCHFQSLSCIDCNKDFTRNTCHSHNKCITEDEKYGGKDWKPKKGGQDKNQKKQDVWLENIEAAVESGKAGDATRWMKDLLNYPNVPRKQKKFENFVRNCMKIRDQKMIDKMWDIIQTANSSQNDVKEPQDEVKPPTEAPVDTVETPVMPPETDENETHGEGDTQTRKKKKKNKLKKQEVPEDNPEPNGHEVEEPVVVESPIDTETNGDAAHEKKKKKKKRRHAEGEEKDAEHEETPGNQEEVQREHVAKPDGDVSVPKKKKKKHKNRNDD